MSTPPEPGTPPAPAGGPVGSYTQADLDAAVSRVAAKEKSEGRKAAETAVAELLGMSPADAKAILDAHKAAADADKSDAQRAREQADAEKAAATAAIAAAAAERHAARVERALVAAGITLPADEAKREQALARAGRLVDAEQGADQAAVTAAVAALKTDMPALFAAPGPAGAPSDPGSGPPRAGQGDSRTALQRGAERARARGTEPAWRVEGGTIKSG